MTPSVTIRPATLRDVPALVEMGTWFIATVYADQFATNRQQLTALCQWLVNHEHGLVMMAEHHGDPIGMLGALAYPHVMSGETTAVELFWWMNPQQRGAGLKLFRAFEQWAMAKGAHLLQLGAPNDHVARFYERLGFRRVEMTYTRRIA